MWGKTQYKSRNILWEKRLWSKAAQALVNKSFSEPSPKTFEPPFFTILHQIFTPKYLNWYHFKNSSCHKCLLYIDVYSKNDLVKYRMRSQCCTCSSSTRFTCFSSIQKLILNGQSSINNQCGGELVGEIVNNWHRQNNSELSSCHSLGRKSWLFYNQLGVLWRCCEEKYMPQVSFVKTVQPNWGMVWHSYMVIKPRKFTLGRHWIEMQCRQNMHLPCFFLRSFFLSWSRFLFTWVTLTVALGRTPSPINIGKNLRTYAKVLVLQAIYVAALYIYSNQYIVLKSHSQQLITVIVSQIGLINTQMWRIGGCFV